tara:strand:+ start:395 stop:622 length:228 start_codon:yes stop_codon:yes gene_type:complete
MGRNKKEINIEHSLQRLESIVSNMESGETSLEKSLALFEEGMNLVNQCQSQLRKAEQRVENLIAGSKDTKIEDEL